MTLTVLADENIPALEHYLAGTTRLRRAAGRAIGPELLHDVDILLVRSVTRVDEALLAGSPVRFVGSATSGIDHIDREYLARRGITFAHAPGANANSVVEYVLAAIATVDDTLERLLDGGAVGIVGCGCVGRSLAHRLGALAIRHRVYDPWLDPPSVPAAATLEAVLDCEVISLHPELTRAKPWPSHHLIDEVALSRLRPNALLINTSRGPVVDNGALRTWLEGDSGVQVVLDVWESEPSIDPALLDRLVLGTPHIAGYSHDGKLLATQMIAGSVAECFQLSLPAAVTSEGDAPAIRLDAFTSPAGMIRRLLESRYAIRADDARLRQMVRTAGGDIAAGFDHLRRSYPERRDLAGSTVIVQSGNSSARALVEALGCLPVTAGSWS